MKEDCDGMTDPVKIEISELGKVSDLQDRMKRLLQYITTDSETGLEACRFCLKVYQGPQPSIRQRKLMDHIDSVHLNIRSFKCQFCDKTYPSKSQLCTHLKLKHLNVQVKDKKLQVPRVELSPPIKNMKSSHVTIKEEPLLGDEINMPFRCYRCKESFTTIQGFQLHFESVHEGNMLDGEPLLHKITEEDLNDENTKITSITDTDPFSDIITYNPWQVESIEAFTYLKCPECPFDCKEEVIFQNHALKNHPLSIVLFDVKSKFEDFKFKEKLIDQNWENRMIKEDISVNDYPQNTSVGRIDFDENMPYSCKICQISFQKLRDHRAHITAFQGGKKYIKCCVCDAKFSYGNFRTLKRHISAVHAIKSYRCPFCTNCFLVKEELEKHKASVHEGKKHAFNCTICNSDYPLKTILKTHMETVHRDILSISQKQAYGREDPNSCSFCQITFQQKSYYRAHITTIKDGKKSLKCCACDKKLSYDVRILQKHIAFVHEGKKIKCSFCNDYFAEKEELEEHEASVHEGGKPTFICIICNSNFPLKSILNTHMETVHEDIQSIAQKPVYDREGPNSCHICQISFHQKQHYRAHITAIKDGDKYLGCCACDAKFSWGNFRTLKRHISAVHESKSYRCPFCTDCFAEKEELEKHKASVHEGKKHAFNCTICNADFPLKITLNKHMEEVHDIFICRKTVKRVRKTVKEIREKLTERVKCDQCDKDYSCKTALKSHVEIVHLQIKKQCDRCPTFFKTTKGLQYHMKSQHQNKTYPCSQCDRVFKQYISLNDHVLRHHEKRLDFKCEYCGKDWPSLVEVNRHIRVSHNSKVKCDICDKVIGNPRGLWLHKIFHHKEIGDALICEKCPRRKCHAFHTKVAYDKHIREVHDKIEPIK